ncbi:MAG: hypothetical protein HOE48_01630 [Candidatus Latescibacteria bacterium]|nr:hypothetical protein [Candidatus Latescibacterota bacterium]
MAKQASEDRPLHDALLDDVDQMLTLYDASVQHLLEAIRHDGYFDDIDPDALIWPKSQVVSGSVGLEALQFRVQLVGAVYEGLPPIRDARLAEAYAPFADLLPRYHVGNQIYLQLKKQFVERGVGDAQDFLKLYQSFYLEALSTGDLHAPEAVEEALAAVNITQVPMSHAQTVAEALAKVEIEADPRWDELYVYTLEDDTVEGSLRELLQDVAQRTLDLIAAGGLLSTRYNYLTNFGWFGVSIWKVIVDGDVAVAALGVGQEETSEDLHRLRAMLVEFLQAHQEDPTKLRPKLYWYGQPYSYLTRDMIDVATRIVDRVNRISSVPMTLPPLLTGHATGRFVDYPSVGKKADLPSLNRKWRLLKWARLCWQLGRKRTILDKANVPVPERYEKAWALWGEWSEATKACLDIDVKVTIDPMFAPIAKALDLGNGNHKILFLPTHQSLVEHLISFPVWQSPQLLEAVGWEKPVPFVILARRGLSKATSFKIGSRETTVFGMSPEEYDRMFEEWDGNVTRESLDGAGHSTPRMLEAMFERPGLIYPMGTTASFDIQLFPLQYALFAKLPQDVVIVPVAFRGTHSLWRRCPKGNIDINPGTVEAVICPPMLGETTLMPKRGSLRIQAEAAALFQAMHITSLLNPEHSET